MSFAVIQTGGKQYRVREGDTIHVESLPDIDGDSVELTEILLVSKQGKVKVGSPTIKRAKVTAEVVGQGKGRKIVVFKYKSKTRYRRKNGHRQSYTDLKITGIQP